MKFTSHQNDLTKRLVFLANIETPSSESEPVEKPSDEKKASQELSELAKDVQKATDEQVKAEKVEADVADRESTVAEVPEEPENTEQAEEQRAVETTEVGVDASPEVRNLAAEKAILRDGKNQEEIDKLDGTDETSAEVKMDLIKDHPTVEYIEEGGHEELTASYKALRENTQQQIDDILENTGEIQETANQTV